MRQENETSSELAAAILLEKIVRDAYERKNSGEVQPLQWSILRYLRRESSERATLGRLAKFLNITHAPVSRAIKTLVKKGFVKQSPNPTDARSHFLILTENGKTALEKDPILGVAQRIQRLPAAERDALMKSIRSMALLANPVGPKVENEENSSR